MDGPTTMLLLSLALLSMAGHSWSAPVQCLCSHELKDRDIKFTFKDDFYIAGQVMDVVTAKNKRHCSVACSSRDFCKSFNFERATGRCELTSDLSKEVTPGPRPGFTLGEPTACSESEATLCTNFACPNTSRIMVETQSGFCVSSDCPGLVPPGANYRIKPGESKLTKGTVVGVATRDPARCPIDKVSPLNETVVCGYNGIWSLSSPSYCRKPLSCIDVKRCDPNYPDGEYWLYPSLFGSQTKVKVYCEQRTGYLQAYVTMPALNWAATPEGAPSDRNCTTFSTTPTYANVTFHKFPLSVTDFLIYYPTSSSFPFTSGVGTMRFFWSDDCMRKRDDSGLYHCSNRGHGGFLFNSTFSGYIITYTPPFRAVGPNATVLEEYASSDGRVLYMTCTGTCATCTVDNTKLLPDPDYEPPDSEATFCQCPL